ncbi:MAG: hypothetical protein WC091_22695 [Sulfuricellaceae bacterium]
MRSPIMVRTLRAGLHGFPGAWRRCNYKRRQWNNHSSSLRLALHPENRTLQPVQLSFLGLCLALRHGNNPKPDNCRRARHNLTFPYAHQTQQR